MSVQYRMGGSSVDANVSVLDSPTERIKLRQQYSFQLLFGYLVLEYVWVDPFRKMGLQ